MAKKLTVPEAEPIKEQSLDLVQVVASEGGEEVKFRVRRPLPLSARAKMVMDIANIVLVEGTYVPIVEEFAFLSTILAYYTDLPLDDMSIDNIDQLCCRTDIMGCVYQNVCDDVQYIKESAQKLISWEKEQLLRAKSDQLYEAVSAMINHLDGLLAQLEGTDLGKVEELTALAHAVAQKSEKELGHGIIEFREAKKTTAPKKRSVRKKVETPDGNSVVEKE